MTINISEYLYLTLQEPLSPCVVFSVVTFLWMHVFFSLSLTLSPHISCYSALSSTKRVKCQFVHKGKKCSNKVLNKAQYKFCMQCKSIKLLFSQLNTFYYVLIHTDIEITHYALQQCSFTIWFLSVHIDLYILAKFYTKSVLKSYASSLLCCTEVRSMLTGTNFTFLVGLATEDKRHNNRVCQKTVTLKK